MPGPIVRSLGLAVVGAASSRAILAGLDRFPPGGAEPWTRTNHRGEPISLLAGPALVISAAATAAAGARPGYRLAAGGVTLVCGAVGVYDDIVGARPDQKGDKGFRGHLSALKQGRVTAGLIKIFGVGAAGVVAAGSITKAPIERIIAGGVVAGTANLLNLLDLRPGRALKTALIAGTATAGGPHGGIVVGPTGASAGLLGPDLAERTMLGDGGANAIGALLGLRLAAGGGPAQRAAVLAVLAGLTIASEKVSFTKVIERTPGLREVDALGRRR